MGIKPVILHITTWYPNKFDEQLGVFIQKHIEKGFGFSENIVLALIPVHNYKSKTIEIEVKKNKHSTEIIVLYSENTTHKYLSLRTRQKAIRKGIEEVMKMTKSPDYVMCHVAEVSLWIAHKFYPSKPVFLSEHWSGFIDGRFDKIPFFTRNSILKRMNKCRHIFVVGSSLKKSLIEKGVIQDISIVSNVIENKSIKVAFNEVFTFGVIADLVDEVKNISGIVAAYNDFRMLHPLLLSQLIIIGDGESKGDLENQINLLGLLDHVRFFGRKSNQEVLEILPTIDTVIVNSYFETYSMVTAEALLSGVPVISTRCGGPEQFIVPAQNGYLVEVNNVKELTAKMEQIILEKNTFNFERIAFNIKEMLSKNSVSSVFENMLMNNK